MFEILKTFYMNENDTNIIFCLKFLKTKFGVVTPKIMFSIISFKVLLLKKKLVKFLSVRMNKNSIKKENSEKNIEKYLYLQG